MSTTPVRTTTLTPGEEIPVLGQGTWGMAEHPRRREDEVASLRLGLDLGMTLIDTAEMYGNGAAEELVSGEPGCPRPAPQRARPGRPRSRLPAATARNALALTMILATMQYEHSLEIRNGESA